MIPMPRHQTVAAYAALVVALSSGGAAVAAAQVGAKNIKPDAVRSKHIKDGQVRAADLAPDAVVVSGGVGGRIVDGSVTGADVDESSLGQVPVALNAGALGGRGASSFASSSVYKREAATDPGTALGDGTFSKAQACDTGDLLLAGGPASISPTTTLLETFPTPGSTSSWSVRINPNAVTDSFTVVILCLDQTG